MEMLLAQPVSRLSVYLSKAMVSVAGLAIICTTVWCGMAVGIRLIVGRLTRYCRQCTFRRRSTYLGWALPLPESRPSSRRWTATAGGRSASWAGSTLIAVVLKVDRADGARLGSRWLFVGVLDVRAAAHGGSGLDTWRLLAEYNTPLIIVGLASYVAGAIVFSRRDLPAPL